MFTVNIQFTYKSKYSLTVLIKGVTEMIKYRVVVAYSPGE